MSFDFGYLELNNIDVFLYLKNLISILAQYSFIYKFKNIEIILHKTLENIPLNWVEALCVLSPEDLSKVLFDFIQDDWSTSLKDFVQQCQQLGSIRFPEKYFDNSWNKTNTCFNKYKKASLKKQLEIETISNLIEKMCCDHKCNAVLDIGSGLGYLDQVLHHKSGVRCLCLDSSSTYTETAKKRLEKDPCSNAIYHHTLKVENSTQCLSELEEILSNPRYTECPHTMSQKYVEDFGCGSVMMVGLHSCGNLMQDMMKIFCKKSDLKAFVCVGCCYNKIDLKDFPMSEAGKSAIAIAQENYPHWSPCTSGLRLAAHGTRSHFRIDSYAQKNMFYRAILEYYLRKKNLTWEHPKRHLRAHEITDFETYCKIMLKNQPLDNLDKTMSELQNVYNEKEHLFPRVRILLVLQTLLQPLWESFICVDRMLFFREQGISAEIFALWDDSKSSRNLALCAYR